MIMMKKEKRKRKWKLNEASNILEKKNTKKKRKYKKQETEEGKKGIERESDRERKIEKQYR